MSSDDVVIAARGLSKNYRLYDNHLSRLRQAVELMGRKHYREFTALQDVSFDIGKGETVGIIGRNGSGKSTLLQLICGIRKPSAGTIRVNGRISALLELGAGFHAEFTGRENLFMQGAIMGLTHAEMTALLPEIEAFAEIGQFIDQPVRTYSSGMFIRLAFAVAISVRPDILIVDEALSVGDVKFQHKCIERIRVLKQSGVTLLIVSHDEAMIKALSERVILLDRSRKIDEGSPEQVFNHYNGLLADKTGHKIVLSSPAAAGSPANTSHGNGMATVERISMLNAHGQPADIFSVGENVILQVAVRVLAPLPRLVFGYMIKDRLGQVMYGTNTHHMKLPELDLAQDEPLTYTTQFDMNLGPGSYSVSTALVSGDTHLEDDYEWRDFAYAFTVINETRPAFVGSAWMEPEMRVDREVDRR